MTHPGPKTLLIGGPGTGKTFALHTLVKAGLEVFVLATDNGVDTLNTFKDKVPGWTKEEQRKIHYHYFPVTNVKKGESWNAMIATGKALNTFANKSLQDMEDINKSKYTQLLDMIGLCADFVDQNSEHFGDVSEWGNDRCIVLDNTTGLNLMARALGCGMKPIITQPDWGKIMDYEERFLNLLTAVNCPVVVIGHVDREIDEITGGMVKAIGLLGRKLAPKIPRLFSDCVLAHRAGTEFFWSTASSDAPDLKARHLPLGEKLKPDFGLIFSEWRKSQPIVGVAPV